MTELIFGKDDELAAWAEANYPECAPLSRPLTAIGVASSAGEMLGVAIYHNFRQNDVEITFVTATPRWATSGNISAILHYPFIQLGVQRMTAITAKANKKARKLLTGLGFVLEGTHPYAHAGKTACTYGLYSETAQKWIKNG
jgi:RimJ/RimL family protein N-acetyltransferase